MVYRCSISHSNLGGMYLLWKYTSQTKEYFCLLNCGNFYLFFMLGVFTTKYRLLEKAKNANWLFSACIVLYAVLFCVEMPIHALDSLNRHILMPFCMVFVIVTLFMARHGETSCFERIIRLCGQENA
jgi:phosphatidylserine synthase